MRKLLSCLVLAFAWACGNSTGPKIDPYTQFLVIDARTTDSTLRTFYDWLPGRSTLAWLGWSLAPGQKSSCWNYNVAEATLGDPYHAQQLFSIDAAIVTDPTADPAHPDTLRYPVLWRTAVFDPYELGASTEETPHHYRWIVFDDSTKFDFGPFNDPKWSQPVVINGDTIPWTAKWPYTPLCGAA